MKRLLVLTTTLLILAACSGATTKFSVEFLRVTDQQKVELTEAVQRVMEGRVLAKEKKVLKQSFSPSANGGTLAVTFSDKETADQIKEELELPFSFRIMTQATEGEAGDVQTEQYGNFVESGLTEEHVDWVDARVPPAGGKTSIDVIFTEEGRTLLTKIFSENKGKLLGVFVRGRLMSLKQVAETESGTSIVIDNVPSAQIAASFVDDVNVSVHTKITAL